MDCPKWWTRLSILDQDKIRKFLLGRGTYNSKLVRNLSQELNIDDIDSEVFLRWWFGEQVSLSRSLIFSEGKKIKVFYFVVKLFSSVEFSTIFKKKLETCSFFFQEKLPDHPATPPPKPPRKGGEVIAKSLLSVNCDLVFFKAFYNSYDKILHQDELLLQNKKISIKLY